VNYQTLITELQTDPLSRGYSGMTDGEVADDINSRYRSRRRDTTPGVYSEWLTATGIRFKMEDAADDPNTPKPVKQRIGVAFGIEWNPHLTSVGWQLGDGLAAYLLAAGVVTADEATSFTTITSEPVSRATELGIGVVGDGHVKSARELMGVN
jgi:hypothetical protein